MEGQQRTNDEQYPHRGERQPIWDRRSTSPKRQVPSVVHIERSCKIYDVPMPVISSLTQLVQRHWCAVRPRCAPAVTNPPRLSIAEMPVIVPARPTGTCRAMTAGKLCRRRGFRFPLRRSTVGPLVLRSPVASGLKRSAAIRQCPIPPISCSIGVRIFLPGKPHRQGDI